jgi:UDP-N-acetyl-2-amino-2-deoxyglucuronate dehydrogenase
MYSFALVGCGRIAPRHAENIVKVGKLVAVCDTDKTKANDFAQQYNAKAYYAIDDLLQEEKAIEVVSICTPNGLHAEHILKSLQANKHVLCEKPMCITGAAAWQILETEKFSRKKLFIVKASRYNTHLQHIKKLLQNGSLGEVFSFDLKCFWNRPPEYYTDWKGKAFPDGGTLYTQFSHYIDALLWLFGNIQDVKGFISNKNHKGIIEFEDTGVATLLMDNNVLGCLHWSVNTYKKNSEIGLTIIAEKGTICLGGPFLEEVRYTQPDNLLPGSADLKKPANDYGFYKGSMNHHQNVYEGLIHSLNETSISLTNGLDGLKTVEAIEKIYKRVVSTD